MEVTVQIPDDIAAQLSAIENGDLSRRALEALVAEEYRQGHLHKPDLRRLLGFETSHEIDDFLKAHPVFEDYTLEDLERELIGLRRLGVQFLLPLPIPHSAPLQWGPGRIPRIDGLEHRRGPLVQHPTDARRTSEKRE